MQTPLFSRLWPNAVLIGAVSIIEIAFSSPLFATLGFEYSALMALSLSFVCGLEASLNKLAWRSRLGRVLTLWSIPLLVSLLSLLWLRNCALWDGIILYFEIALPSALLGGAFGAAFSMFFRSRRTSFAAFVAFWIFTLVLSLLPGYTNPQLFTYGWQYGFFPGFVWDESLELSNAYLIFRFENFVWAAFVISIPIAIGSTSSLFKRAGIPAALAVAAFWMFSQNDIFHITSSHVRVEHSLSHVSRPAPGCVVHFDSASLSREEIEKVDADIRWYLFDIRQRFLLRDTTSAINLYIYPSAEALNVLVGTRAASIAKPWLGEVHIAKSNLHSLKHELTHVLLREKAAWPFYASWSTGLTEGAAMSVEPEFDGIYTLNEHAARILQLRYAFGVKPVMAFTGFAANASTKSYVLAGSFSRFLLNTYGPEHFDRVYVTLNFEKEYGKPIDSLDVEWKRWLAPLMTPLEADDSEHFRYYYDRASIIFNPCLRRIGKLERKAQNAFVRKEYTDAERLYRDAVTAGGGIGPLVGESYAILMQDQDERALELLDTSRSPELQKQRAALYLEKADLGVLTHVQSAQANYASAERVKISSGQFILAYVRSVLDTSDVASIFHTYLHHLYHRRSLDDSIRRVLLDSMAATHHRTEHFDRVALSIRFLQTSMLQQMGMLTKAAELDPLGNMEEEANGHSDIDLFLKIKSLTATDSLAISIVSLHFASLPEGDRRVLGELLQAEMYCPQKYARAVRDISDEIDRQWHFRHGIPPRPFRGMSP